MKTKVMLHQIWNFLTYVTIIVGVRGFFWSFFLRHLLLLAKYVSKCGNNSSPFRVEYKLISNFTRSQYNCWLNSKKKTYWHKSSVEANVLLPPIASASNTSRTNISDVITLLSFFAFRVFIPVHFIRRKPFSASMKSSLPRTKKHFDTELQLTGYSNVFFVDAIKEDKICKFFPRIHFEKCMCKKAP